MEEFDNVTLVDHPLVARDVTLLRDRETKTAAFRRAMHRVSLALALESLGEMETEPHEVETPIRRTEGRRLSGEVIVVPILRAGLGMTGAFQQLLPEIRVGHLGMYRDETTHQPVDYYSNIPPGVQSALVVVVDPMLATGGSAHGALTHLKKRGAQHLRFVSLISAPEGIKKIRDEHPDVPLFTAAIDEKLDDDAFIVPGLGDAGDRYFDTI